MESIQFSRQKEYNYSLQNKQLFKKKAGNAKEYYQLFFDETLEKDLSVLHKLYISNKPFKIFGQHTNLYITERGYDGLFVDINPNDGFITFDEKTDTFCVTSNVMVSKFVNYAIEKGYDFSSLAGIPGLIGSGVAGNSGYTPSKKSFSDFVQEIIVYDFKEGKTITMKPNQSFFDVRNSLIKKENTLQTRYFVKSVVLKADFIGKNLVREKYNLQMEKRKEGLYFGFKEGTAGSLWSNDHLRKKIGKSFPKLLKANPSINCNYNGATYSLNGSMFFTTSENTTDKDVAKLFIHTLKKTKEICNVKLHKEVIILDYDGEISVETFIERYGEGNDTL